MISIYDSGRSGTTTAARTGAFVPLPAQGGEGRHAAGAMIRALRELRGVGCPYCGHDTRVFSSHCGLCRRRKPLALRLPLILLYLAPPLLVLVIYLMAQPI